MKADVTVVVITLNRPECLARCMAALEQQTLAPRQVIVVDASQDLLSRHVMDAFPSVHYISAPELFGKMTASRNRALMEAHGSVIAFLDDDAYAHPCWLARLMEAYQGANIGGVGGRAINGQPGEETADEVGVLKPNGFLVGNFASDPGEIREVDHIIGCNMSFRREVLERLGGFREEYGGISGVCEDSDFCMRVKALGYRLRFQPAACVDHEGAPQAIGKRFNASYQYHHRRNNCVMLMRHFGPSAVLLRFSLAIAKQTCHGLIRDVTHAFARCATSAAGMSAGIVRGLYFYLKDGTDPVRHDAGAEAIRNALRAQAALAATNRRKEG